MASSVLQDLAERDFDRWLPLWRDYQAFYQVVIADEITATTWRRLLDSDEPMNGTLIVTDGVAVGFVHWITHRSCWTTGDYCYLQDLFVGVAARGQGCGRRLIEHVYERAGEAGCSRVYWLTHETNADAMRLYDRVAARSGFVQYRKVLEP